MVSTVTIAASCAAALISLFVSLCKLADWRRHRAVPKGIQSEHAAERQVAHITGENMRAAPCFSGKKLECVAKFCDIVPRMKTGGVLTFSGRAFHSYIIRIAEFGDKSHVADVEVRRGGKLYYGDRADKGDGAALDVTNDSDNEWDIEVWIIDSCEGRGITRRLLYDEVCKYPGQWYYSDVIPELEHQFDRRANHGAAMKLVKAHGKYGYMGIGLEILTHAPFLSPLAYALSLNKLAIFSKWPFCSQFKVDNMRHGGLDLVHGRDSCLCGPQDVNESAILQEWTAIMP